MYWPFLSTFARRDLQILVTQFGWYWSCIFLPSLFAGVLAHWLMRGGLAKFDWSARVRCWFASLLSFLAMVVVGLAAHWWEEKQPYHRVDWFAATAVAGFFAPFFSEIFQLRRAAPAGPPMARDRKRWIFSLRSAVAVQLFLLVAGGLWIGSLRQEIAAREAARRAADKNRELIAECFERFARSGLSANLVFKDSESHIRLNGISNLWSGATALEPGDVIQSFEARSRNLTKADLQVIYQLPITLKLKLGDCFLDADSARIRNLDEIRILELRNTTIAAETIAAIAQLPKLEDLKIESSLVNDEDFVTLCNSKSLKFLAIESIAISDRGLEAVAENRSLQTLVLRKTQISPAAAEQLRIKRPELKLIVGPGAYFWQQ